MRRDRSIAASAGATILAAALLAMPLASCGDDSVTGPSSNEASPARSVITAAPDSLESGQTARLELETRDASGARVRRGGRTVVFYASGEVSPGVSGGTISSTVDRRDGTYTATFTATNAGIPVTIGATIDGDTVTTASPTLRVTAGPATAATSSLTLSTRRLDVGGAAELEVQVRDAAGNVVPEGGRDVAFTATGGTSAGTIGATVDQEDGTYTAPFHAEAVGTALVVAATMDGDPIPMTDSLRVVAGLVSPSRSELTVSTDTVTVGTVVQLLLRARDDEGRELVGGGSEVVFSVSTGSGVSEGVIETDSVDLGNGTYTADFHATKPGTATTISATLDGEPITTLLPAVTVKSVTPSAQTSTVGVAADALAAGDSTLVTLTVYGPDSTAVTSGGLVVDFVPLAEPGTSSGDVGEVTDHEDGTYTARFVARGAGGPVQVSATMEGTPVEMLDEDGVSRLPTITVSPGPVSLDSSLVEVSDDELALGETSQLTLRTRDDFANPLVVGGLDVALTATVDVVGGPAGDLGPVTDVGDGTYTAVYTATEEVTALISASIGGEPLTSDSVPIIASCSTGDVSVEQSTVTVADTVLPSGVGTTVQLQARDADGHCLRNTGLDVAFGASGGTSTGTFSPPIDQGDGSYAATFTGVVAGTPTMLTATIGGVAVTSPSPGVVVIPGDVSAAASELSVDRDRLDVGAKSRIRLTAFDAAGNRLPVGGLTVAFSVGGGTSGGSLSPVTDNADGTYVTTFTATDVGSAVTAAASIDGNPVTGNAPTIEVVAGPISADSSLVTLIGGSTSGDTTTIAVGDTITARLIARDAEGRELAGGGRTVEFSVAGGTTAVTLLSSPAVDGDDGTYSSEVVGAGTGTPVTVEARIDGSPVTSLLPVLVVE